MKRTMSLLLALGMFATMLAPCAAAEEVTPENAEVAAVAELEEEAAPEASDTDDFEDGMPEVEGFANNTPLDESTEEVPAEVSEAAGDIAINATNFPDAIFRKYVENSCDRDKDGY